MSCQLYLYLLQIRGANVLGLPVITTEQYPKALGNTVQELKDVMTADSPVMAKTLFSMLTPDVKQLLKQKPTVSQVGEQIPTNKQQQHARCCTQSRSVILAIVPCRTACSIAESSHGVHGWSRVPPEHTCIARSLPCASRPCCLMPLL